MTQDDHAMPPFTAAAVIVAAGRGERFGLAAKCLVSLAGRPLLAYSLDAADAADCIAEIVIVAGEHTLAEITALSMSGGWTTPIAVVLGGRERQHSVVAGAGATSEHAAVVVVHDAARPLVSADDVRRCAEPALMIGAAIMAAPVVDTIKRVAGDRIIETVPREGLWSAQTPQAFRRADLLTALASEVATRRAFTDEAGLFEALGYPVTIVPSHGPNLKITHPGDLSIAEALIGARSRAESKPERATGRLVGSPP